MGAVAADTVERGDTEILWVAKLIPAIQSCRHPEVAEPAIVIVMKYHSLTVTREAERSPWVFCRHTDDLECHWLTKCFIAICSLAYPPAGSPIPVVSSKKELKAI